ncbi:septum site-determining protein MinD [mine drainage metagenome]|uniref:Septum site-determining protein MinD n=1 Tax=mine drainage metagenome TaxID=410659 RepID=A0A1J5T9K5_9ZZZZ
MESMRQILQMENAKREFVLFDSVDAAAQSIGQESPDLVILNGHSLGIDQLAVLERFSHQNTNTSFIVLCENATPEFLIGAMRIGVKDVLSLPLVPKSLSTAVALIENKLNKTSTLQHIGKVITFIAGKGGSGATFLACNLGYILASSFGKSVALLDLNLQFGDAALFVSDKVPANTLTDVASNISRLDASLLASSMVQILPNFGVLAAPEDAEHAVAIKPDNIDALLKLAKTHYDYVILDIGRTLNATSVKALDHTDHIFLVIQETLPFIRDSKRLIHALLSLGYAKEKIQLVLNRYEKGGDIQLRDVESTLNMKVFETIPNSYEAVSASVNQGVPIMKIAKHDPVTKALLNIADKLTVDPKVKKDGWLTHLLHHA